jgi:hypothetical protein
VERLGLRRDNSVREAGCGCADAFHSASQWSPQTTFCHQPHRRRCQSEGHAQAEAEGEGEEEPEGDINVVENGDSALLLLRALAAQDPDVTQALKGEGGLLTTRSCAIM